MPGFLGGGLANPDETVFYVPVPKCGSSSHRAMFGEAGWHKFYWTVDSTLAEAYMPVRHPIDRWWSGIDQYVRSRKPGHTVADAVGWVLDGRSPVFDENTQLQTDFVLSTMVGRVTTVKLDNASTYVAERWGLELPTLNSRLPQGRDERVTPILVDFYADDWHLYRRAG